LLCMKIVNMKALYAVFVVVAALAVVGLGANEQKDNVELLSDADFAKKTGKGVWLVLFQVPSCKTCRDIVENINGLEPKALGKLHVGSVDCQQNPKTCTDVSEVPVIRVYAEDKKGFSEYAGYETTTSSLLSFAQKSTDIKLGLGANEKKDNVEVLSDADFAEKTGKGVWLVLFHIPSCKSCQRVVERMNSLEAKALGKLHVGSVDCQQNPETCTDVSEVPVIRVYAEDKKGFSEYAGYETTTSSLFDFAQKSTDIKLGLEKVTDSIQERLEDVVDHYLTLSRRTDELNARLAILVRKLEQYEEEDFLTEVRRTTKVLPLSSENFTSSTSKGNWIVLFGLPFWPSLKALQPVWEAVGMVYEGKINVAKVDCYRFEELCKESDIHEFITIRAYIDGKLIEYTDEFTPEAIEEFISNTF